MKDNKIYDFLDEIIAPDNQKIEEISRRYPVLDKSSKKRIAKLCEEKLIMKNEEYFYDTSGLETDNNAENNKKIHRFSRHVFAIAASLLLVVGLTGVAFAGLSKNNLNQISNTESVLSAKEQELSIKELESNSGALIDSFNTVEKIYGGNILKDENQKYTYNGTEYAKVTDKRFTNTDDVRGLMENYLTAELIDKRYLAMFESENPWLIDVDGALYIKLSARGAGYTFTGNIQIYGNSVNEDLAILKVSYDNYGQTDMMIFQVKKDRGRWKINNFESVEMAEISTKPTEVSMENTTDAPVQKTTDAYSQPLTEAPETSTDSNSDDMEISIDMAYTFMNAIDFIDQLGGNGIDVDYDMDDYYDGDNGVRHVKVTEPGFACVADVRNYLRTYLTDSYISERYSGLIDSDSPMLSDFSSSSDSTPQLYSVYSPKGCGFQWTGKVPTIEKKTDDMYIIFAECDDYGVTGMIEILIVRDTDGRWKINMIIFGHGGPGF